jgi:hypothetical protein
MSRRTYHIIAAVSSPLPVAGAYFIGKPLAQWLAALDDGSAMLTLLGYLLGVLAAVLLWAVVLLPLRARAGFVPVTQELAEIRREGVAQAVAREYEALNERERSRDPRTRAGFHALMAMAGGLLSLVAIGVSWVSWQDGYAFLLLLAAALVCPVGTVYHLVQWTRHRSAKA